MSMKIFAQQIIKEVMEPFYRILSTIMSKFKSGCFGHIQKFFNDFPVIVFKAKKLF